METLLKTPVGHFVAQDYKTAAVFSAHKIDFCCNGNISLEEICNKKGIDPQSILDSLHEILSKKDTPGIDYNSWPLDLLTDYIVKTHHKYVEDTIPVIISFLNKLCTAHGELHPELLEITNLFTGASEDLTQHMRKEEIILFPFIKKMVNHKSSEVQLQEPPFATVKNPISMMMQEHNNEGERFRKIAALSNDYQVPEDGCITYRVAYSLLKEFEENLHLHIHLENNILFPKALHLEKQVMQDRLMH